MAQVKRMLRKWNSEDGSNLIEFALVLPMLLLVVLGIAEFGFIFQRLEVVTNAAREGARLAVLPGNYTFGTATSDVEARVRLFVTQAGVPTSMANPTIVVTPGIAIPVGGGRPPVTATRVTVTYTHNYFLIPGIGDLFGATFTSVPLTAVAEMRNEGS